MAANKPIYLPSGRLGRTPYLVVPLGMVIAVGLSFFYVIADVYNPITGIITPVLLYYYAWALAHGASFLCELGKCRSKRFAGFVGFLLGLFGFYASWILFLFTLSHKELELSDLALNDLVTQPTMAWAAIKAINQTGWYILAGTAVDWILLWIFWALEPVILLYLVVRMTTKGFGKRVFCEHCDHWCQVHPVRALSIPEKHDQLVKVADGDLDEIQRLSQEANTSPFLRLEAHSCSHCAKTYAIKLKLVISAIGRYGLGYLEKEMTPILLLEKHEYEQVMGERRSDEPNGDGLVSR